jgi:hypothetical protein
LHRDVRRLIEVLDGQQVKPKGVTSERIRSSGAVDTLTIRTYPVADLVVPVPGFVSIANEVNSWKADLVHNKATGVGSDAQANLAALMKHIRTAIEPESWTETGGRGTITSQLAQLSLVISQTPAVHDEVAAKFEAMRRHFDSQTSFEIRVVTLPAEGNTVSSYLTIMGENQVLRTDQTQRLLEHCQGDTRTNILQAPKITLFNSQSAEVTGALGDSVTRLLLHNSVSDGSETVRLRLAINPGDSAESLRSANAHRVLSGDTLVLDVTEKLPPLPVASNVPSPILNKVPYVSRLFRVVPADQPAPRTLLLITPHVVSTPEEEVP